jgi:hypothetical protein
MRFQSCEVARENTHEHLNEISFISLMINIFIFSLKRFLWMDILWSSAPARESDFIKILCFKFLGLKIKMLSYFFNFLIFKKINFLTGSSKPFSVDEKIANKFEYNLIFFSSLSPKHTQTWAHNIARRRWCIFASAFSSAS